MVNFSALDLLPSIKKAIAEKGYTKPTPIQEQSIPHLLKGKDLLGIAQTGTGKTAAFSLPLISRLGSKKTRPKSRNVRALILTPTRELASQIEENIQSYSKGLKLSSAVVFGGVAHAKQIKALNKGLDILIATPGRLLDLMDSGYIRYDELEVFILDEADRMLDMGFLNDVKKVIKQLPKKKQTLLFSATMPKGIIGLANSLLRDPVKVEVTPEKMTVEKIAQRIHLVKKKNKPNLLLHILSKEKNIKSVLIFTRTKRGANKALEYLEEAGIRSGVIHGNKSQNAREKALEGFRSGKFKILIATDIASRGIDVDHVSHVINYDLPEDPEVYVHRIGRTARAGREGVAISFCDQSELSLFTSVEKFIKKKLNVDEDQPYHTDRQTLEELFRPKPKKASQNNKRAQSRNRRPNNKKSSVRKKRLVNRKKQGKRR